MYEERCHPKGRGKVRRAVLVPKEGIEPTRVLARQILSLLRLPVPPLRHWLIISAPE